MSMNGLLFTARLHWFHTDISRPFTNPLPNNEILDWSELKALANEKIDIVTLQTS